MSCSRARAQTKTRFFGCAQERKCAASRPRALNLYFCQPITSACAHLSFATLRPTMRRTQSKGPCRAFVFGTAAPMRSRWWYFRRLNRRLKNVATLYVFPNLHTIVRELGGPLKKINKQFKKNE